MKHHAVILAGDKKYGRKAPPSEVGRFLSAIEPAVEKSLAMSIEGRSTLSYKPAWLTKAADIRFIEITGRQETILHFEARTIGEAYPKLFDQQEMWSTKPDEKSTGFDVFSSVLSHVTKGMKDSDRFDRQLLGSIEKFSPVLNGKYQRIEISGAGSQQVISSIDEDTIAKASDLKSLTPQPQMVKLAGILDMIRWSNQSFGLKLSNGETVYGILMHDDVDSIKAFGQKKIIIEGKAIFRPSGKLLRIETYTAALGEDAPKLWEKVPKPISKPIDRRKFVRKQTSTNGVNAYFGKWPGDESEEELLALLEASA